MKVNNKITLLLIGLIINTLLHAAARGIQVSHAQAVFGIGDTVEVFNTGVKGLLVREAGTCGPKDHDMVEIPRALFAQLTDTLAYAA